MGRQLGLADRAGAGLGHRVVVLDGRAADADRADSSPSASTIGMPPGNVISPSFECSMPKAACPAATACRSAPVSMPKNTAVLAFFRAMSIEPTQAPSMR